MGFHLSKIDNNELGVYIGSNTINAAAEAGAFDSPISPELESLLSDHIIGIVDAEGVKHCLSVLENNAIAGRDIQLLISEIKANYSEGFKIHY